MITKTFQLETLTCPSCVAKIEGMLKRTEGVTEWEVLFNSSRVRVSFDESVLASETIKNNIDKLGFRVIGEK
jgi:copper chaperone